MVGECMAKAAVEWDGRTPSRIVWSESTAVLETLWKKGIY